MNKNLFNVKRKMGKALLLGSCFTLLMTGSAFAESRAAVTQLSAVSQETAISDELLKKQSEIDRYVFEEHAQELADKGITVTHTGQVKEAVEIGITPYNQANADYLYNIFGKDGVVVVEGEQAVTFGGAETPALDDAAAAVTAAPASEQAATGDEPNVTLKAATQSETAAESGIAKWLIPLSVLAALLIPGGAFMARKLRAARS